MGNLSRRTFVKMVTVGGVSVLYSDPLLNKVFASVSDDQMVLRLNAYCKKNDGISANIYFKFLDFDLLIEPGDILEYDVYVPSSSAVKTAAVDIVFSDNKTLRDSKTSDQNGLSSHPAATTGGKAVDKWYRRSFKLDNLTGKTIEYFMVAASSNPLTEGQYTAFFKDIKIIRKGEILTDIISVCDPDEFSIAMSRQTSGQVLDVVAAKNMTKPLAKSILPATIVGHEKLTGKDTFAEYPSIASDGMGKSWAAWLWRKENGREQIMFSEFDHQWKKARQLSRRDGKYETPRVACAKGQNPALVWVSIEGDNWKLRGSIHDGKKFSKTHTISRGKSKNPTIIACVDGSYVAAWEEYKNGIFSVQISKYYPGNDKWSKPISITDGQSNCYSPALVIDKNGLIWIAYAKAESAEKNIYIKSCDFENARIGQEPKISQETAVYINGKRSYLNSHPALTCDGKNRIWITWEQVNENKRRESIFENVECMAGCLHDGKLFKVLSLGGRHNGKRAIAMANNRYPVFHSDIDGRMWLFARESYPDRRQWKISASVLTDAGWAASGDVIGDLPGGRMDITSVCACDDEHVWVTWQSDNILETGHMTNLFDKHSGIHVAKLKLNKADAVCAATVRTKEMKQNGHCQKSKNAYKGRAKTQPEKREVLVHKDQSCVLLMGNLHEHSDMSRCWSNCSDGNLDENYRFGIDVEGYDFVAITDHGYDVHEVNWRKTCRASQFYTDSPWFVGLSAFEWTLTTGMPNETVAGNGHRNVIFASAKDADKFIDPKVKNVYESRENPLSNRPDKLWKLLKNKKINAVTIPHHITDKHHPMDWDYHDDHYQSAVEIFQARASSEYPGCPLETSNLTNKKGCTVREALERGHKFGFIASGDHNSMGVGLACVYVKNATDNSSAVSSEAIVEALLARRCYATTGDRIILDFAVNDNFMGSEITADKSPHITARITATDSIKEIVVFKNDKIIYKKTATETADRLKYELEFNDKDFAGNCYYYLRVIQENGQIAWASPVWVNKV